MSAPAPSAPPPGFHAASELSLRLINWLWPGRLALGELSTLEGDPGLGKSLLALDLCARLSTGRPWPDGTPSPGPAACVYLNGEDDEEATVGPRLRALGADLGRVFLPNRADGLTPTLSLPAHTEALDQVVARTQARLLVVDPVMHFFGAGVDISTDAGIRRALAPLGALARRRACAVMLHRHLNKNEGGRALYRGLGGIGLVSVCRSAWLVAAASDKSGRRVLAQVKNNLAPPQPSLAFEVAQAEGGSLALNWLGPVEAVADELLRPGRRGRKPVQHEGAMAFLREALAGGPLKVRDIWARALKEGLSSNTVRDAKKDLGVLSEMVMEDGRRVNYWLLPDQTVPRQGPRDPAMEELDRHLKALSEMYPPKTPLEDDDF